MRAAFGPLAAILLCGFASTGCVTRWRTNNLLVSDFAGDPNPGARYVIVQMRDLDVPNPAAAEDLAAKAMRKLSAEAPAWFADTPDSIPVVVGYRMFPERETYGVAMPLSGILWVLTLGTFPYFWEHQVRDFQTFLLVKESPVGTDSFEWDSKILSGNVVTMGIVCPRSGGWENVPLGCSITFSPPTRSRGTLDLMCASILRCVQHLTPAEREWIRKNDEAWYLDAKQGNRRNRPVAIVGDRESSKPVPTGGLVREAPKNRPRIASRSWSAETRRGSLVLDLSECEGRNAALAWARDEYLPDYCRALGVAVSADDPASAPAAGIRVLGVSTLEDGTVRIEFFVVE